MASGGGGGADDPNPAAATDAGDRADAGAAEEKLNAPDGGSPEEP